MSVRSTLKTGDWRKVFAWARPNHIITDPPYDDLPSVEELRRLCPQGNIIMFSHPGEEPRGADEYLFWVKSLSTKNYKCHCGRFVEVMSVFRGEDAAFNCLHWSQMTGVYSDLLVAQTVHPFQKPLTLMERLVRIYTKPGELVCDPYMGSGTTGMACRRLGRRFVGTDIDKSYVDLARKRIASVREKKL